MARNTPIELILLTMAEGLQTLIKNPDLSKLVKENYACNFNKEALMVCK